MRKVLQTPIGMFATACILALGLIAAWFSIRTTLLGNDAQRAVGTVTYVCAETKKPFDHKVKIGELNPIMSPYSGKATGYPGVPCYWNADGSVKSDPTWLLANETLGLPGPTFCPDCGRLVGPFTGVPRAGDKPPPTRQEYEARHSHLAPVANN